MKRPVLRQCLACRNKKDKRELVRIVKDPQGQVLIDRQGKAGGRGAYLCKDITCVEKAKARGSLERALQCSLSDQFYKELMHYVTE